MRNENRVVMMKITITNTGARNMGDTVIPVQPKHTFVARQNPVRCQRKGFELAFGSQFCKHMRHRAAFMIAALGPNMMELCTIRNKDFHHFVKPCCRRTVFQNC